MSLEVSIKSKYRGFTLDIDFADDSKRIGILGASGSGKSMTLKTIAGIECPENGRIVLDGHVLFDSAEKINTIPQKRNVGYLFQNYALFPTMNVYQNIASGLHSKDKTEINETVKKMIGKFRLQGLEESFPAELSGGQQQRVALARIMAYEPSLILLDEPFSALDIYLRDRMQEELNEMLEGFNGTVIMVSHSRDEIYRFSDTLLIIDRGRIIRQGETNEVFSSPGTKTAAILTGCRNISAATVMDEHTVRADDWGIVLKLKKSIPSGTAYLGYRAHEFIPLWGEREENSIPFRLLSKAELQFEKNYYIKPGTEVFNRDNVITWSVQRDRWEYLKEKGLPSYLRFNEDDILFLKES